MIRNILKGIYKSRRDQTILRYYELINALSSLSPEINCEIPKGKNVLVLAAHCDDETAGCGGTLYKYYLRRNRITAVFMTDGSMCGYPGTAKEIIALRKEEAKSAGNILGIEKFFF
tara:strand:+ start:1071 stop:1418 length:348 start_codon:yes stop_codon:yes gene_type:complete